MEDIMIKYIDAEKLIAKIKELNSVTKTYEEQVAFNNALAMVVEIIDSLQQEQLSDNLDESAEKYAWQKEEPLAEGERLSTCFNPRIEAYKAGAEWMANQGVSTVAISNIEDGITEEGMKSIADYLESLPDKTEVVLQIRKKQ